MGKILMKYVVVFKLKLTHKDEYNKQSTTLNNNEAKKNRWI